MIPATPSMFPTNRFFRWTVIIWILSVIVLAFFLVYGILLLRPDRVAEKRDVAIARQALEERLRADDRKRDEEHAQLMERIKSTKRQQDRNVQEIRNLKQRLGE